ncbi:MAG: DNA polymerase III subunit delta', partial [Anaerolineae bacterium]|nr:DNA polymerase III subunit delta' [Anaerolineae bacterium]
MKPWPIVGHQWAVQQLQRAVAQDEVPHALLITGPESVGKHTLAQHLVMAILCNAQGDRPCGVCLSCRKVTSGNHPDFMTVAPEERTAHLRIDEIRDVERFLALTPRESAKKVALVGDFERATIGAANALLKTLEEPPGYAHIILLATDADQLLPTIVSRSQQIALRPVVSREIAEALVSRWGVAPDMAQRLARLSGGRIGWAVRAATNPEAYERMQAALAMLLSVLRQDLPARFETAKTLSQDDDELAEVLEVWLTFWRDVLLIQSDSEAAIVHTEHRATLEKIAAVIDVRQSADVLTALE